MKNILESYLNYLNEKRGSSINKQIRSGNLSPESIEKLKKAGLIKPEEDYKKGVEKGIKKSLRWKRVKWDEVDHKMQYIDKDTIAALKKMTPEEYLAVTGQEYNKADIDKMESLATKNGKISMGPVSDVDKRNISIPKKMDKSVTNYAFGSKKGYEDIKPLVKKHEADEYILAQKLKKKYNIKGKLDPSPLPNLNVAGGGHYGPEVLKKEKKVVDFYNRVYGKLNHWLTLRKPEYEDLKKYGSARALRKTRERAMKQGIRDALVSLNNLKNEEFADSLVKLTKQTIRQQLKMLPKSKRNLTFVTKVLKIIK